MIWNHCLADGRVEYHHAEERHLATQRTNAVGAEVEFEDATLLECLVPPKPDFAEAAFAEFSRQHPSSIGLWLQLT